MLERRESALRVTDERGALPDDGNAAELESIMTMEEEDNDERAPARQPTAPSRKRRVAFDDNDDPRIPDDAPGLKIALNSDELRTIVVLRCHQAGHGRRRPRALREPARVGGEASATAVREVVVATRAEKTWRTVAQRVRRVEEREDLRDGEVDFACVFARDGHEPSSAHVLLVLFSPSHS